jgi:hypothetical protein
MLKTIDQRCFFTHKNNYPQLIEFARTCDAEISVVKTQNVKVLELTELARSICNHDKQSNLPQYEVVEIKLPKLEIKVNRSRKKLLAQANIISSYVNKSFLSQNIVSLEDLESKFSEFGLSKASLRNHIAQIRKQLISEGYQVSKIKCGQYKLSSLDRKYKGNHDGYSQATDSCSQP